MNGAAWWDTVHGVKRSGTRLSDFTFTFHISKIMLKILQARLQQYMNCEFTDVQAGFIYLFIFKLDLEKTEEPEIKLSASVGSLKEQESSRKTSISALLTLPKPLTVWITINSGKF